MTKAVSKRDALCAAYDWLGTYEGWTGDNLHTLAERYGRDIPEGQNIPEDIIAAYFEMRRQIYAYDAKTMRGKDIRYVMSRLKVDRKRATEILATIKE